MESLFPKRLQNAVFIEVVDHLAYMISFRKKTPKRCFIEVVDHRAYMISFRKPSFLGPPPSPEPEIGKKRCVWERFWTTIPIHEGVCEPPFLDPPETPKVDELCKKLL